jgi:hypothetical protein
MAEASDPPSSEAQALGKDVETPADQDELPRSPADAKTVLQFIAQIGSPVALITVLLLYFGWVRSDAQARALGYDVSLLAFSTQDYVLHSINILFFPIVFVLLMAFCLSLMHQRILRSLKQGRGIKATTNAARALKVSWAVIPIAGAILVVRAPSIGVIVLPMMLTLGILGTIYGVALQRRLAGDRSRPSVLTQSLVVTLLTVTLFWSTERVAGALGNAFADYIAADPTQLVSVTIFSPKKLQLSMPGIVETRFTDPNSAYGFRYDGLRLLLHSGGKYFLLHDAWNGEHGRVIVIPDDNALRFEFTH